MGLFDFLAGGQGNTIDPNSQGLMALSQALLKAGQPSPYKTSTFSAVANALPQGMQGYRSALDQKAVQDAISAKDPTSMLAALSKIQDPAIQSEILKSRLKTMTPSWKETKDAFGNPLVYNELDPSQTKPLTGGANPFAPTGTPATTDQTAVSGDEFLKTLNPQIATQVKALAEGRMTFPGGFALKSPYWQQMISAVSQYDPTFDAVNYSARSKTRNDFTSGKSAQNITAMNTALGHINSLLDNAEALNNTSYPSVNAVLNWADTQTGDPRVKNFNTTKDAVADELTRVFRGTGGSVTDIQSWKAKLDAANSPEQFKGVAKEMAELLGSRLDAVGTQYNQGMGTTKEGIDLLSPKAQQAYQRLSGEQPPMTNATGTKTAPVRPTLPPAAAIAHLKANPALAKDFEAKYGIPAASFLK